MSSNNLMALELEELLATHEKVTKLIIELKDKGISDINHVDYRNVSFLSKMFLKQKQNFLKKWLN